MRTFVAAWPDEPTRLRLAALELGHPKNLRPVGPTRWHVTLRFLGEVTDEEVGLLGPALRDGVAAHRGPLQCRLGPATAWFSRVRVLQLPAHGLDELAAVVARATAPIVPERGGGEPALQRPRQPGPGQGPAGAAGPGRTARGSRSTSTFAVEHVDLVASEPSPQGHVYTTLVRAPLGTG